MLLFLTRHAVCVFFSFIDGILPVMYPAWRVAALRHCVTAYPPEYVPAYLDSFPWGSPMPEGKTRERQRPLC